MTGYCRWMTIGATLCSACCASFAACCTFDVSPVLTGFFASFVGVSLLFCFGCRWALSLVVGGNLAFSTVACLLLARTARAGDTVFWPLLGAMVLAPSVATIAGYLWGDLYCRAVAAALKQPSKRRRFQQSLLLAIGILGGSAALFIHQRVAKYEAERLESSIARVPNGITAIDADRLIGRGPDEIHQVSGVLVNGTMLLDAANSKAATYGVPQPYEVRLWRHGGMMACVAVDGKGNVAGRWTHWEHSLVRKNLRRFKQLLTSV